MGEMTLTAALVRRLQRRGLRVLASTRDRRDQPRIQDDLDFPFVRFREYPDLT